MLRDFLITFHPTTTSLLAVALPLVRMMKFISGKCLTTTFPSFTSAQGECSSSLFQCKCFINGDEDDDGVKKSILQLSLIVVANDNSDKLNWIIRWWLRLWFFHTLSALCCRLFSVDNQFFLYTSVFMCEHFQRFSYLFFPHQFYSIPQTGWWSVLDDGECL